MPTHIRVPPWLVGFVTGYILFQTRTKALKLNWILVVFLWTASLVIMFLMVVGTRNFAVEDYDVVASSFFNGFARTAWGIAICVVTFLCVKGYGGGHSALFTKHNLFKENCVTARQYQNT